MNPSDRPRRIRTRPEKDFTDSEKELSSSQVSSSQLTNSQESLLAEGKEEIQFSDDEEKDFEETQAAFLTGSSLIKRRFETTAEPKTASHAHIDADDELESEEEDNAKEESEQKEEKGPRTKKRKS